MSRLILSGKEVCAVSSHRDALVPQLPDMLAATRSLVEIDSGSGFKSGVDRVGLHFGTMLRGLGFSVETVPQSDSGDFVCAEIRLGGTGGLLIAGHLDTVWPEGTASTWRFSHDDEFATGPGVGDMKSALVMAFFAARRLLASGFNSLGFIRFLLVPDEEVGSVRSRSLIEERARDCDWALVLEPARPGGGVVTARGTVGAFVLTATGITAHCAHNYKDGASAVRELAQKVVELESLSRPDLKEIVNVGIFDGGTARQVVPGCASMHIDLRAPRMQQATKLVSDIERIAGRARDDRVVTTLSGGITRPGYGREQNRELFAIAETIASELGIPFFEAPPTSGGSDANIIAALGIPTLDGIGPTCWDMCSARERIEVRSLIDRAALFCGVVECLGRPHTTTEPHFRG